MKFLHTSVRLHTDLGRAFRCFSQPDQMMKWLCKTANVTENNVLQLHGILEDADRWEWKITDSKREEYVYLQCSEYNHSECNLIYTIEIRMMKCTSLTEYCSEIHIIQKDFSSTDGDSQRDMYQALWNQCLERLRQTFNGSWIISDRDLTFDILK